jgi:hypothetical protein
MKSALVYVTFGLLFAVNAANAVAADNQPSGCSDEKAMSCLRSGGQVELVACSCTDRDNFPNTCLIGGGCTCTPVSFKDILMCQCPDGTCFDGERCVGHTPPPHHTTQCEEQGGTCIAVYPGVTCPAGYEVDKQVACGGLGAHCCMPRTCDDGTKLLCMIAKPHCPAGTVAAVRHACWQCVDPISCEPAGLSY